MHHTAQAATPGGAAGRPEAPSSSASLGLPVQGPGLHLGHGLGGRQGGGAAAGAAVQDGLRQRLRPGGQGAPQPPPSARALRTLRG